MSDADIAKNLGPGPDQYPVTDLGMPVAVLLAGAAKGHGMQHGDIVPDNGSFTDDDRMGVVDHDPFANSRSWMDIDTERL